MSLLSNTNKKNAGKNNKNAKKNMPGMNKTAALNKKPAFTPKAIKTGGTRGS